MGIFDPPEPAYVYDERCQYCEDSPCQCCQECGTAPKFDCEPNCPRRLRQELAAANKQIADLEAQLKQAQEALEYWRSAVCDKDPTEYYGMHDSQRCYFCHRDLDHRYAVLSEANHEGDCEWLKAQSESGQS